MTESISRVQFLPGPVGSGHTQMSVVWDKPSTVLEVTRDDTGEMGLALDSGNEPAPVREFFPLLGPDCQSPTPQRKPVSLEPNPSCPAPDGDMPRPSLKLRGRGSILVVTAYFALAAAFFIFNLRNTANLWAMGRVDTLWASGDMIRAVGATLLTVLLWRYAAAMKRYNRGGESTAAHLESAHTALWRAGAAFVILTVVNLALNLSRPAIRPPSSDGSPPTEKQPS